MLASRRQLHSKTAVVNCRPTIATSADIVELVVGAGLTSCTYRCKPRHNPMQSNDDVSLLVVAWVAWSADLVALNTHSLIKCHSGAEVAVWIARDDERVFRSAS